MDKVRLSVIIPCYNSGDYLSEAIESVHLSEGDYKYEIIIIDDGSTDSGTLELLKKISTENIKVIHQENRGPASARNTGIRESQSEYILFLDSDNKVKTEFISTAINIFEKKPEIDIVYGKPEFFGEMSDNRFFKTAEFDLDKMWFGNYIDMCAIIKASVIDSIGLLDERMIGHEDWEFWIRAGIAGKKFYFLDQPMFDYRVSKTSLTNTVVEPGRYNEMIRYVYGKNYRYFQDKLLVYKKVVEMCNYEKKRPFKTFIKNLYSKYYTNRLDALKR
jgi:glycosyltransferase involved in cell wall biosynthesis